MFYWAFYLIVIFAGLAMMVREGLWSNTLTLITILFSGLVAFGFYSPIVIWLDEMADGEHTYWLDFAVLWALYCITLIICRMLTAAASKTRMRFKHPIDPVGGPLVGLIAAWVLACFTLATFHASPMWKDAFSGKLVTTNDVETASAFTSPDAAWLRFVDRMNEAQALGTHGNSTMDFDARRWVKDYSDRRAAFEKAPSFIVDRGK
jgi:uncharacterized membrane protein required for colicin V production